MKREEITIRSMAKYPNFISAERVIKHIPLMWYMFNDRSIYIMTMRVDRRTTKTGIEAIKYMNERYVFEQLGLQIQQTQTREVYYIVRTRSGGSLDISSDVKFAESHIDRYCIELNKYLGFKYWVYVRDYLTIKAKAIITIYDTGMNPFVLTDEPSEDYPNGTIEKFVKTPFFLVICEKEETIRAMMKEMKVRGFGVGFYGVALGKNATSYAIKLLIRLAEVRNFHTFILHDLDISGLKIYLNMRRWIKAESIGVNTDFLEYSQIDSEDVNEDYKVTKKDIQGFITILNACNVNRKEYYQNMKWMWACLKKRIELNSISAYRLEQDLTESKVRDYCDYLIYKISDEDRKWNLNRYRVPAEKEATLREVFISSSDFMVDIEKDVDNKIDFIKDKLSEIRRKIRRKSDKIRDKAYVGIDNFLKDEDLAYSSDWVELIKDKHSEIVKGITNVHNLQCDIMKLVNLDFMRVNKRYKGEEALKNPDSIVKKQDRRIVKLKTILSRNLAGIVKALEIRCKRLIKRTEKYKDFKEKVAKNEDTITKSQLTDYIAKLRNYTIKELDTIIFIIKLDSLNKKIEKAIRS